jgi:hypothetical protein
MWYRAMMMPTQEMQFTLAYIILGGMQLFTYLVVRGAGSVNLNLNIRRLILFGLLASNLVVGLETLVYTPGAVSLADFLNRPVRTLRDMAELVPAEFILVLFVLLVSWRGISYSNQVIGPSYVIGGFRVGIAAFLIYGMFGPLINEIPSQAFYFFLFFSLLAMSVARISVHSQMRGGHRIQFNRQWLMGILLVILFMVGLAMVVAGIVKERLFSLLSVIVAWVIYVLVILFSPLLLLVLRFVLWLGEVIRLGEILRLLTDLIQKIKVLFDALIQTAEKLFGFLDANTINEFFRNIIRLRPLFYWGSILFLMMIILLTLRRYLWKEQEADDQEIESLLDHEDLVKLMRSAIKRGWGRMFENLDQMLGLRRARRLLAAARVRRIYAALMSLSSKLGQPRPVSRTPLEFLPSLAGLYPGFGGELETITNAYMLVRYGGVPESTQEVEQVEKAWRRVARQGKEQLRLKRRSPSTQL